MGEQLEEKTSTKTKKPKWLKRLEKESWQAELIISGLALYGTFMLPPYVNRITDLLIKSLAPDEYWLGYALMVMAYLGVAFLSGFFLIHFVLRGYWVGLIGLNSVYPDGYNMEGGMYSKYFMEKIVEVIPDVTTSIKKVDAICSTLFSGAFLASMIYISFALIFSVLLLILKLFSGYVPEWILWMPIYIYGSLITVLTIVGMIGSSKKMKENLAFQKIYYKITRFSGKVTGSFLSQPISQISLTFFSNNDKKVNSMGVTAVFMLFTFILYTFYLAKSNTIVLIDGERKVEEKYAMSNVVNEYYEDLLSEDYEILNPVIPSDQITTPFLKIFIPVFSNESDLQTSFCGDYVDDDNLSFEENKTQKRLFNIQCYNNYHQIFVNDSLYKVELLRHRHSHMSEFGVVGYIPTSNFKVGKNKLTVVKLKDEKGEHFREDFIPFWFAAGY